MRPIARNLAWAGAGAMLAWVAVYALREDAGAGRIEPRAAAEVAPDDIGKTAHATPADPLDATVAPVAVSAPANAAASPNPIVVWSTPKDAPVAVTDLPNRRRESKSRKPATELLDQSRVSCDFGAGVNTGLRLSDTLTVGTGAQWQGGLMVYDLLEPGTGRARLAGTVGAAGSPTGEAKMQLMIVDTRVYFLGVLPNSAYMVTTIYDELDDMGRHVAVMSRHENAFFTYADQFLGVCY